jgi:MFS transporter, YNFM family, putative membrane transport protein
MTVFPARSGAGPAVGVDEPYRRGDDGYRRITWGLFAAGLATFISLYCTQAVLPDLSADFGIDPATAALAVSVGTGAVALAIIPASTLSERFGRTRVMTVAAVIASVIALLLPLSPSFGVLLAGRALQGIALAGVPAVGMAYLSEEVHGGSLGAAMGRYIAGNTVGGLAGRLISGSVLDVANWRWALGAAGAAAALATVVFLRGAMPSRFFTPRPVTARTVAGTLAGHLRRPALLCLFALAFLLMGGFVTVYNYAGFRLDAQPFDLPDGLVALIFLFYLSGTWSSAAAGRWADRFGRPRVLLAGVVVMTGGLLLTLPDSLGTFLPGMLLFTAGFFAAHSVASGWVGALATVHRAQASALYLFGYYLGSAGAGALGGVFFTVGGWGELVAFVGGLLVLAVALAAAVPRLGRISARRTGSADRTTPGP